MKEEQSWVWAKLAELEYRSHRNTVKLRGIPKSIQTADIPKYAKELMHTILPDASPRDIISNQIHRLSKLPHLAASVPRDLLMKIHFFHIKEKLLAFARANSLLPPPYEAIQSYLDLSKYTLQLSRQLNPITKGVPAMLLIRRNGTTHVITNLKNGLQLLRTWGVIIDPPTDAITPLNQHKSSNMHSNQGRKSPG